MLKGKIDILSLFGVGFLTLSLVAIAATAASPQIKQIFLSKAISAPPTTPGGFGYSYTSGKAATAADWNNPKAEIAGTYVAPNGSRYLVQSADTAKAAGNYVKSDSVPAETKDAAVSNFAPSVVANIAPAASVSTTTQPEAPAAADTAKVCAMEGGVMSGGICKSKSTGQQILDNTPPASTANVSNSSLYEVASGNFNNIDNTAVLNQCAAKLGDAKCQTNDQLKAFSLDELKATDPNLYQSVTAGQAPAKIAQAPAAATTPNSPASTQSTIDESTRATNVTQARQETVPASQTTIDESTRATNVTNSRQIIKTLTTTQPIKTMVDGKEETVLQTTVTTVDVNTGQVVGTPKITQTTVPVVPATQIALAPGGGVSFKSPEGGNCQFASDCNGDLSCSPNHTCQKPQGLNSAQLLVKNITDFTTQNNLNYTNVPLNTLLGNPAEAQKALAAEELKKRLTGAGITLAGGTGIALGGEAIALAAPTLTSGYTAGGFTGAAYALTQTPAAQTLGNIVSAGTTGYLLYGAAQGPNSQAYQNAQMLAFTGYLSDPVGFTQMFNRGLQVINDTLTVAAGKDLVVNVAANEAASNLPGLAPTNQNIIDLVPNEQGVFTLPQNAPTPKQLTVVNQITPTNPNEMFFAPQVNQVSSAKLTGQILLENIKNIGSDIANGLNGAKPTVPNAADPAKALIEDNQLASDLAAAKSAKSIAPSLPASPVKSAPKVEISIPQNNIIGRFSSENPDSPIFDIAVSRDTLLVDKVAANANELKITPQVNPVSVNGKIINAGETATITPNDTVALSKSTSLRWNGNSFEVTTSEKLTPTEKLFTGKNVTTDLLNMPQDKNVFFHPGDTVIDPNNVTKSMIPDKIVGGKQVYYRVETVYLPKNIQSAPIPLEDANILPTVGTQYTVGFGTLENGKFVPLNNSPIISVNRLNYTLVSEQKSIAQNIQQTIQDNWTKYVYDGRPFPRLKTSPVSDTGSAIAPAGANPNILEVNQPVSWSSVVEKPKATVIDVKNIEEIPQIKGRVPVPQEKPQRELYPVEVVSNLFFSEKEADSGRKLVQEYLDAVAKGEDVTKYVDIAKSFLKTQETQYASKLRVANSQLADRLASIYKVQDINSIPTEDINDLALVRVMSSPDPIGVDAEGNVVIQSTFLGNPQKDAESLYRTSKHFTVNGAVAPVKMAYGGIADWSSGDVIVITPMNEFIKINGPPNTFSVQDTWWTPGTYDNLILPKGTVLIIRSGSEALNEYANLPGVLIIKANNPYASSAEILNKLGYQYKAQGTEFSQASTEAEKFLNENVFAYKLGAQTGLHFYSPTMNIGDELAATHLSSQTTNNLIAWSEGTLPENNRLSTIIQLIQDGYFSSEPINGLYIPPERLPNVQNLSLDNFDKLTTPLTRTQKDAVDNIIAIDKLAWPDYWSNQGIVTKYKQLVTNTFTDPTLGEGLPLLKPQLFGLTNDEANFLRQNINDLTKTTIPISNDAILQEVVDVAKNTQNAPPAAETGAKPTFWQNLVNNSLLGKLGVGGGLILAGKTAVDKIPAVFDFVKTSGQNLLQSPPFNKTNSPASQPQNPISPQSGALAIPISQNQNASNPVQKLEAAYPNLANSGLDLKLTLNSTPQQDKAVVFIDQVFNDYNKLHPLTPGQNISQADKQAFTDYIKQRLAGSEYSYILNSNISKNGKTYNFDYFMNDYVAKWYGFTQQNIDKVQQTQCVVWQILIAAVYPQLDLANIEGYNIDQAKQVFGFADNEKLNAGKIPIRTKMAQDPNGKYMYYMAGDTVMWHFNSAGDVQKGDTYVYGNHMGVVVNKFTKDGKLYFEITEANSPKGNLDGTPVTYIVDELGFNQMVGLQQTVFLRPKDRTDTAISPLPLPDNLNQSILAGPTVLSTVQAPQNNIPAVPISDKGFTYYSQYDPKYAGIGLAGGDCTIANKGCALMALGMVTKTDPIIIMKEINIMLGYNEDLSNTNKPIVTTPTIDCEGSGINDFKNYLKSKRYGIVPIIGSGAHNTDKLADQKQQIANYTRAGTPVWVEVPVWMYDSGLKRDAWVPHVMIAVGVKDDGTILFNDPAGTPNEPIPDSRLNTYDGIPWVVDAIVKQP